ncbi:MAG: hypothetical protein M1834_003811 [Cirrosporium novae-zelandiae]|nr:MAG: hypothetical protein M1834_003811 [Cirrosporium novae-zelandiae]
MTSTSSATQPSSGVRRFFRPNLRQATLILPRSGRRVRRTVTLRGPCSSTFTQGDASSERSPLLGRRRSRSGPGTFTKIVENWELVLRQAWALRKSRIAQGVLKCSLAYLLGSMATFVAPIAAFLGHQDGKHIVATITVYFHPARSQGSMFEAMVLAALAFLYFVFVSFTSMGVTVLFGNILDLLIVGHVIVLIVFCGGGLGFIGWFKQRLGSPLVNVACSLASLATITVLTKEGDVQAGTFSNDKVIQVMKMVIMGVMASTTVSFLIFPISAREDLRQNMIDITDSFADMLAMITRSFLWGSEDELKQPAYKQASDRFQKISTAMSKNLKEAKYEHHVAGREKQYQIEAKLVKCMQRLAQNLGGLRSAASTEFALLQQSVQDGEVTPLSSAWYTPVGGHHANSSSLFSSAVAEDHFGILTSIDEAPEENEEDESGHECSTEQSIGQPSGEISMESSFISANSPADIFSKFIFHLGPSMKSLAFTVKQILDELPFGPAPNFEIRVNSKFRKSLEQAIELYTTARSDALALLYKSNELNKSHSAAIEADFEEVAASCGHFSFSLQDFAQEVKNYLDILDELQLELSERPTGRTWNWLKLWRRPPKSGQRQKQGDPERDSLIDGNSEVDIPGDIPSPAERRGAKAFEGDVPYYRPSVKQRFWKMLRVFRRDDIKFAIKVGVGAALYALPSFLGSTRPFYQHWRGEWGLLSYMLVCSMTIGASNTTGYSRFIGTCIGALCAILSWTICDENPFALAAFGWFMALWTAYIIVGLGNGPMGRFIMLTYNLSALYAYSLSVRDDDDDDDEGGLDPIISEIVAHRVVAVFVGCLWGLFITRIIWPISARRKLTNGLSLLWLRMGLIWKRDPLSALIEGESPNPYMNLREEFELQRYLSRLQNLRKAACSEFDLRGPFPNEAYGRILASTGRMLDAFHAMNVIIMKGLKASEGEKEILRYTASERAQLSLRISFLFQVIASSMKLEYPLNDALPNTSNPRDRLLSKIFGFRRCPHSPPHSHPLHSIPTTSPNLSHADEEENNTDGSDKHMSDEDFALLYAYALVTGQIAREIEIIVRETEKLFGVLDEDVLKLQ